MHARCEERMICGASDARGCDKQTNTRREDTSNSCVKAAEMATVTCCEKPAHLWRVQSNLPVDVLQLHGHTSNVDLVQHSPQDLHNRAALATVPLVFAAYKNVGPFYNGKGQHGEG